MLSLIKSIFSDSIRNLFNIRQKPRVIQLPITSRCNSRCVTCNVWKYKDNTDINPDQLQKIFSDSYFNKVNSIGVNGGELTMVPNLESIIDAVLTLPALKCIYVISNGLLPDKLLETIKMIKNKSNVKGVKLSLQLSVDGIGSIHEKTRGVPGCFPRSVKILNEMKENQTDYCDIFSVGCTISRSNVSYLRQMVEFFKNYPFEVYYHLAVPNKRIHTFNQSEYYVFNNERDRLLAEEFFFDRMNSISARTDFMKKFQYFSSYYFIKNGGKGRLSSCGYTLRDLTIDENMNVYLCATASDSLGNLNDSKIKMILKQPPSTKVLANVQSECENCIHYSHAPNLRGLVVFGKYLIKNHRRSKIFPRK